MGNTIYAIQHNLQYNTNTNTNTGQHVVYMTTQKEF